jgi:hypothetical protein
VRSQGQPHARVRAALHEQESQEPQSQAAERRGVAPKPQAAQRPEALPDQRPALSPGPSQPPAAQAVLRFSGAEEAALWPCERAS